MLKTVYLINFKNLICVYVVKCQVKICLLLDFLHIILFLTNLASTGLDCTGIKGGGLFVYMYLCMYVYIHECMYIDVLCMHVSVYVCMYHTYIHDVCIQ